MTYVKYTLHLFNKYNELKPTTKQMANIQSSVYPEPMSFNEWAQYIHNTVRDTQRPKNQIYKRTFDLADAQRVINPLNR